MPTPFAPGGAVETALTRYFGFGALRPGQEDALRPVVEGRDALIVMPTGAGKSLIYQLGALLQPRGVTVVVSPLIALMKDQVDALRARGIAAVVRQLVADAGRAARGTRRPARGPPDDDLRRA